MSEKHSAPAPARSRDVTILIPSTTPPNSLVTGTPTMRPPLKRRADTTLVSASRIARAVSTPENPGRPKRVYKFGDLNITMSDTALEVTVKKPFRFLDLPAEIRNMVYNIVINWDRKEAVLIHRPRLTTLRPRTRRDRTTPLLNRDPEELPGTGNDAILARHTNRPGMVLTQICRQIRSEAFPWYTERQEIGIYISDVAKYLGTFYSQSTLTPVQSLSDLRPFRGNLTIALPETVEPVEPRGLEVLPLFVTLTTSSIMQAGFGRYNKRTGDIFADGSTRDLYRLLGCKMLPDDDTNRVNFRWRYILRNRRLVSITIHRRPPPRRNLYTNLLYPIRPYIHILFRTRYAEPWMMFCDSPIPENWLKDLGFDEMEYFDIRAGAIAPYLSKIFPN